jgi:5-methylcytosine-specific restriction endonuclease McrA
VSTTHVPVELRRAVRERAAQCCEYCLVPESHALFSHEIDHIIAEKHGGQTSLENLCLSCAPCNQLKGTDLASIDPETNAIVRLFRPRQDRWTDHFLWKGAKFEPRTDVGRVTARLLRLNAPNRVAVRSILLAAGVMRPQE